MRGEDAAQPASGAIVSVLMPCFRDAHLVERSLPRILGSSVAELEGSSVAELEVVLLNNDDGQLGRLRELVAATGDARVRVVELPHGAGFIRAVNEGLAQTSGGFVFLANSDLFVTGSYVEEIVRHLESHPGAGCATGKTLRFDLEAEAETTIVDSTGVSIGRDRGPRDRGQNRPDAGRDERAEEVFGVSGAALIARRKALESVAVGGHVLDETFAMYKEDVDLSWRLRLAGWECWYVPSAIAYHVRTSRATDTRGVGPLRAFHANERGKPRHVRVNSMKNQWLMLVKNEDASNLLRDLPFVLGRELLVLGYNTLFAPRITFAAMRGFVRNLPAARRSRRQIMARRRVPPRELRRWFAGSDVGTLLRGER